MAKPQTAKSTIAKDPFETLIPDRSQTATAEVIQHPASTAETEEKTRARRRRNSPSISPTTSSSG